MSELEAIDKVLDINVIYDNPSYNGEGLFWETGVVRSEYTVRDYKKFQAAIVKLALKYPKMECNHSYGGFTVCMGWGDFKKEVVFYYNLFCGSDKNSNCYINRTIKLVYVFFIVLSFGICMFDM